MNKLYQSSYKIVDLNKLLFINLKVT